ncbi:MAG: hypothetical protein FJY85_23600 [Deltaproteobacteria bacterium]|nr:hypothetical protein [Deltaproteobacteria bacterium]
MSFADFQRKLICWLCQSVNLDPARLEGLEPEPVSFRDDFKDQDAFLRRWSWPPDSWHVLAPEGLRLAHSTFPILTKTLGLLRDCEFRFRTRIEREAVGWVIKGTVPPGHLIPAFCVMFNLSDSGRLRVHILNEQRIASNSLYQIIKTQSVEIEKSTDGWLNLITKTRGDIIEVSNEGRVIFGGDFSKEPYVSCYGFPDKQGQVGFRCCGSEEATVNFVEVTELSTVDLAVT